MTEYNEIPASSISPAKDDEAITHDDVVNLISKYIEQIDYDLIDQQMYDQGYAKQPPAKINVTQLLQSINMLMCDFIKTHNEVQDTSVNNILNGYFQGVNQLTKVLDVNNIKVAETKMLLYIIGYLLKLVKQSKQNDE